MPSPRIFPARTSGRLPLPQPPACGNDRRGRCCPLPLSPSGPPAQGALLALISASPPNPPPAVDDLLDFEE
ncbi:hypothetical protein HPB52_021731 [Rhipicephalus sanguineus]|uniref:Uncharacterized protein n=1 Tax=Rhipicephalus sanguineus TaxID=34632 RepID=A0A9D4T4Q9_RHISA|nr:hypothetical protein HPB52_021731 [Rhipicephalus sanguineus]